MLKRDAAAEVMEHLVTHSNHGYDQARRWGDGGKETITLSDGSKVTIATGDRDCSSAEISAFEAVGISCGGAQSTHSMRECMTKSGNFCVRTTGQYIAQRGDVYLNDQNHTAMCVSSSPDLLAQFSINEKGGVRGGQVGDQTGGESSIRAFYNYPWDCTLECINKEHMSPVVYESWMVQTYTPNNTSAQLIHCNPVGGGWYKLIFKANGMLLNVTGAGKNAGTPVWAHVDDGTDACLWRFEDPDNADIYDPGHSSPMVIVPKCAPMKCLTEKLTKSGQGSSLVLGDKNRAEEDANKRWGGVDKGDGYTAFICVDSMRALDLVGGGK
jgi:hypothetical protein